MGNRSQILLPPEERGPLRVMFILSSMEVGGAERLTAELIRGIDRSKFLPELCCLKQLGTIGETLIGEVPTYSGLLGYRYDFAVMSRLSSLLIEREIDAVITVGAGGDRMFWGRLAAYMAKVPVICSALHPSGTPEHVEWPNRLLAPITDAFIAVAQTHAEYLEKSEGCPRDQIRIIQSGIDTLRYAPARGDLRKRMELGLMIDVPTVGIIGMLSPEKNHDMFLYTAQQVLDSRPGVQFLIIGDGPERGRLMQATLDLRIADCVYFVGMRDDVPDLLSLLDVFMFTSTTEANPLAILESLACGVPVVSTKVGSVHEFVIHGSTGYLVDSDDVDQAAEHVLHLLGNDDHARALGSSGRELVCRDWSLPAMIRGYEEMLLEIYRSKCTQTERAAPDISLDDLLSAGA